MPLPSSPIGVFDSGVGGLSVLRALVAELPNERFVYLADSGHAPYGERSDAFVAQRTHAITEYLRAHYDIKALVIACNTATAAAIHEVRNNYPTLALVGVEPALKPAVGQTRTGRIGVIGTRGTLNSTKFARLLDSLAGQAEFVVQPCDGLANAIERSVSEPSDPNEPDTETFALCKRYLEAMGSFGATPGCIDTLVLGCTHYVFASKALHALAGQNVQIIETGAPVARQTRRLLESAQLLAQQPATPRSTEIQLVTTGPLPLLQAAAARWLQLSIDNCKAIRLP